MEVSGHLQAPIALLWDKILLHFSDVGKWEMSRPRNRLGCDGKSKEIFCRESNLVLLACLFTD
jgi:hypothetical protein